MAKQTAMDRVRALYAKNSKVKDIIDSSTVAAKVYVETDGIPIPEGHPFRDLTRLPCLPFNKIVQYAGKPDTGKSTMGALLMVEAQRAGFKIVLWDTEEKFSPNRFKMLGGDPDAIEMIRTNEIIIGGQLIKDLVTALKEDNPKQPILIVWDSVGGGVSRANAEINRIKKKNAQPGQEAKENGQVTKDIVSLMNKYRDQICVYMANQTYAKIGFMQKGDKAKGGDGVEFFSSIIVFVKRLKVLTREIDTVKEKIGIIMQAVVTKNHLSEGETSVYEMNFEVTAKGVKKSDFKFAKKKDDDEGDDEDADE